MYLYLILIIVVYFLAYKLWWDYLCKPKFTGKTVFITGASSGIGEELAKQFTVKGAKKIILSARRIPELERVKNECMKLNNKIEVDIL